MLRARCFHTETFIKYTWNSPDEQTHKQVDHILIDRRWSIIFDVLSFRGVDCDTYHYLVIAKVTERMAVSKQTTQKFEGERFNLRKLNELEVRKRYHIKISKRLQLWIN